MLIEKNLFGTTDKVADAIKLLRDNEPPELMRFIRDNYPTVIKNSPRYTMAQLIIKKKIPPLRLARYCCAELKERGGRGRVKITGIRAEESPRRARPP